MKRKGVVLAGGTGTRLHPLTLVVSKQLLPVFDKPMIYYPLSALMLAGIREILVITTPDDRSSFERLLGSGEQWGVQFSYAVQAKPEGLAQALIIAEEFLAGCASCLVLGDNLLYGHGLPDLLRRQNIEEHPAIFAYRVDDPGRYGVVEFDERGLALSIEEKPLRPQTDWAVIGLYFYDQTASQRARRLRPSARGELEITDLNNSYLSDGLLKVVPLGRGFAWFDAGTHSSLLDAAQFIGVVQKRQRSLIGAPEEIAFLAGWISQHELAAQAEALGRSDYGKALARLAEPKGSSD